MTNQISQGALALVIDDDPSVRLMVRAALEQHGFAVEDAPDGAGGLAAFDRLRPDVVLLDIMMPGMDGFQVCGALRSRPSGNRVPILIMTGLDDTESINLAYRTGATDFITKPIAWPVLGYRLRYLLRANQAFLDLAKSETRLANAQRIAQIGNWDLDIESGTMTGSDEFYRIIGRMRGELPDTIGAFLAIVHADDRRLVEEATYAAMHRGQPYSIDFRIVLPAGGDCVVNSQAEIVRNDAGKPIQVNGTIQNVTERKRAEEHIRHLALHDNLTGLPNRQLFKEEADHAIAQSRRHGGLLATLFLDLDRFKNVNDTFGHNTGDALLKEVAVRLARCVRHSDYIARTDRTGPSGTIARLGGDEFSLLLSHIHHAEGAALVAQRVLEELARPFMLSGHEIFLTVSIGIALHPLDGEDVETLLKHADSAMYFAKQQGRNNYQFFTR